MSGGYELRENENESEDTSSSVGLSLFPYSSIFFHIASIFFYFEKSPFKVSILPERRFKAISVFYTVAPSTV